MKTPRVIPVAVLCVLSLTGAFFSKWQNSERVIASGWVGGAAGATQNELAQQTKTITLLDTTDSHGHIVPWDYYENHPADLGLAKIATLVRQARADAPDALLLDCGDTTEGTPFAYYFARKDRAKPNPEIAAFNSMH